MKTITISLSLLFLLSCSTNPVDDIKSLPKEKQLNITILLDLSDRIDTIKHPGNPHHYLRDIEVINHFTEYFKTDMEKKGAFNANGKLKVMFSPQPSDNAINDIARALKIDLSKARDNKDKKRIFDNVSTSFKDNLMKIYQSAMASKSYPGSDIWRFFKNDVKDYCIDADTNYRNILVVMTDGYVYHQNSTERKNNRTASLSSTKGFRTENWQDKFEKGDYGYISKRSDLNNLEVLALEINPDKQFKYDEDVIRAYLRKWFEEMNIKRFKLYNSDLPEYTESRIDEFLKG